MEIITDKIKRWSAPKKLEDTGDDFESKPKTKPKSPEIIPEKSVEKDGADSKKESKKKKSE